MTDAQTPRSRNRPNPSDRVLDGCVAAVTGAGRGLGRAYALALAGHGASVVVNDIDPDGAGKVVAEIVASGGAAVAVGASVAEPSGAAAIVDAALSSFGTLDVMVTNAGADRRGFVLDLTPDDWAFTLGTHLFGTIHCSTAAARVMKERGSGAIVNITSAAFFAGSPQLAPYCTAKGGIYGFMRAISQELAPFGISVNAVAPPFTVTEPAVAYIDTLRSMGMADDAASAMRSSMELPDDITDIVVHLASPAGRGHSGELYTLTRAAPAVLSTPTTTRTIAAPPTGWTIAALAEALAAPLT